MLQTGSLGWAQLGDSPVLAGCHSISAVTYRLCWLRLDTVTSLYKDNLTNSVLVHVVFHSPGKSAWACPYGGRAAFQEGERKRTRNGTVLGTSLVVQWLRIHHAVQEMWVQSLVRELDPKSLKQLSPSTTAQSSCTTRKIPCAATKAQCSQINLFKKKNKWHLVTFAAFYFQINL